MGKKKKKLGDAKGYIYILPWIVGFLMFQLLPLANSFRYSLTNIKLGGDYDFIGLDNYLRMFTGDADIINSVLVTLKYIFMTVPAKLIFALAVAMLLSMKIKGIRIFRTVYYLPSILGGSVAISALWRVMFMKTGIVNNLLGTEINWLGDPKYALITIGLIDVWQFGSSMVLFFAALKQVPADLYEAAQIDGAGKVRSFFQVTLPMISPVMLFNIVMQTINALQNYTSAYVVTGGGPIKSTNVMALKIYEDAFVKSDLGYASAESWLLFVLLLALTGVIFITSKFWVFYGDEGGE
ncbi:MAG TPA: sugar ABC transporter permease [Sellimonas intestinalis]|uniref:carbohydrate ABC transporter permease n=1 Tax=Lachnoclostridium sp. An169 TaxID=1965569 RepID=UPI000B394D5A|nr:sugar ABC transporter permease [Lachnoclostridium sp. An169]OUP83394.1 ABC transporter permease [Lachnoclostridium sp. An169]HJA64869.1 sugar ABC transporter permease [Candidatus Mediterraneibacter cottocaccae]HJE99299.1 sugar ABC transporter permease [Sellimonas intestinalis]